MAVFLELTMEELSLDQCEQISGGRAGALVMIMQLVVDGAKALADINSDTLDLGSNIGSWNAP
jgi:hypothetical protein